MSDAAQPSLASWILEIASAVLGICGTYLMSRRYASSLLTLLLLTALAPVMFLIGRGRQVREYFEQRMQVGKDVPVANERMAFGLALLCWAFLLQLVGVFVD